MSSVQAYSPVPILLIFATPGTPEFDAAQRLSQRLATRPATQLPSGAKPVGRVRFVSRLSSVLTDLELVIRHEARETFVAVYLGASPTPERWSSLTELAEAFGTQL